nr:uncharacterized protein LOC117690468 [Crassostrea gigas]
MNVPRTTNVNTSVNEHLAPTESTCRSPNLEQGLLSLANSLAQQMSLSRLPPPEPYIFFGDPLNYPGWKVAFQALIEQRQIPVTERIHYLKKYIGGPVKDVIGNYFLITTSDSFEEAKSLLDQRYRDPFIISSAFRDKLDKWPTIARDGPGLQKFSDFLRQCYTAMRNIGNLDVLNDSRENQKMLSRLPDWLVVRWGRIVVEKKEESYQYPPFKDFMEFISKEAKIACDPVISIQAVKSEQVQRGMCETANFFTYSKKPHRNRYSSFADIGRTFATFTTPMTEKSCALCKGEHYLNHCNDFLAMDVENRKKYAKENNLCFGCLNAGHISKHCEQRLKCRTCGRNNPTSLHGDIRRAEPKENSRDKKSENSVHESQPFPSHAGRIRSSSLRNHDGVTNKTSMIVPVYVSHRDKPDQERLVYALLDTQSDTTFILEDTYRELGLSGTMVKLLLSTMYAENQVVESHKVRGLVVRGFNNELKIPLPDTFTRNIMPADRSHIPTPEVANAWPYLKPIASEIMPLQNCEIRLLIGYNCARALIPRDVIAPQDEGPYGQRTDLVGVLLELLIRVLKTKMIAFAQVIVSLHVKYLRVF